LVTSIEWTVKEKQVKYLTIILREVDCEDDQKTDGRTLHRQILMNAKVKPRKRGKEREMTGRIALRRGRSAMDCRSIGGEGRGGRGGEEEEDLI
jgi:hypothetical protein